MNRVPFAIVAWAGVVLSGVASPREAARQSVAAPAAEADLGPGGLQYSRLVVRDAMLVNGRGTPAEGPIDIVVERDTIADIIPVDGVSLGNYGRGWKRPEGDRVIDAAGMYVLPGLVDMHVHIPRDGERAGPRGLSYSYKLWLAHGFTTVRDAGSSSKGAAR